MLNIFKRKKIDLEPNTEVNSYSYDNVKDYKLFGFENIISEFNEKPHIHQLENGKILLKCYFDMSDNSHVTLTPNVKDETIHVLFEGDSIKEFDFTFTDISDLRKAFKMANKKSFSSNFSHYFSRSMDYLIKEKNGTLAV